jgi:hypothetical protein
LQALEKHVHVQEAQEATPQAHAQGHTGLPGRKHTRVCEQQLGHLDMGEGGRKRSCVRAQILGRMRRCGSKHARECR